MNHREALFIISVAARLVDMHPSTLRKYERCGLLEPCRMSGRLRLYSPDDIERLRQIKSLVEERGINLAGVDLALSLTERCQRLRQLAEDDGDSDVNAPLKAELRELADDMLALLGATSQSTPDSRGGRESSRS